MRLGSGDGQDRWGRVDLGFGSVEVSGPETPWDLWLLPCLKDPHSCLSVPWICDMLSCSNLRLPFSPSVFLSVCILISITLSLFFRSPSTLLHPLGYISISFSLSLTFLVLALPPHPPPSLSLKYIHMQIYLCLSVSGFPPSLCPSLSLCFPHLSLSVGHS